MSSTYGENLKLSLFGQSHGPAVGMVLDGIPAGLPVDTEKLQAFLDRRAPGRNSYSTPRKESDTLQILSGIVDGCTCGAPVAALIPNENSRSRDYENLKDIPRPGHADFTAQVKYGGFQDAAGGGHFSGRLTAPLCIAGGMCMQWLEARGIHIGAHITSIGSAADFPAEMDPLNPKLETIRKDFPVFSASAGEAMRLEIEAARVESDSIGGIIECAVTGLPAGIGEPMFGGMESRIAQIIYAIPAVKGLEFGAGFHAASLHGSENNDPFSVRNGKIVTETNHAGGILGGITSGMPLIFRLAVKPTPSIGRSQKSVSLTAREPRELVIRGRHDPCIVPRAVPAVEAAAAVAVLDAVLGNTQTERRK